jgi:hypothetical protein
MLANQKNINGASGWNQQATDIVNKALKFIIKAAQKPALALNNFRVIRNISQLVPVNNNTAGNRRPRLVNPNNLMVRPLNQKNRGGWSK